MDSEAFGAETGSSSRVLSLLLLITGALIPAVVCEISVPWMVILASLMLCLNMSTVQTNLMLMHLDDLDSLLLYLSERLTAPGESRYGWSTFLLESSYKHVQFHHEALNKELELRGILTSEIIRDGKDN
ncbi:hypothetical protein Pyn_32697 [Prunus yedoensis var. nudiflora]|uniref:Uncharacterized protein n=1 Tax=Prunus yedoensis var. nudiflora TaxID=2094558 RepID=A0A315B237_PRUYE|nr:hypothetical protein Pyn_32697 [Prunus yedoensis var. nudiflora]